MTSNREQNMFISSSSLNFILLSRHFNSLSRRVNSPYHRLNPSSHHVNSSSGRVVLSTRRVHSSSVRLGFVVSSCRVFHSSPCRVNSSTCLLFVLTEINVINNESQGEDQLSWAIQRSLINS